MIKRLDHINLVVTNLEEAESFFVALGFSKVQESDLDSSFLTAVTGLQAAKARFVALALESSNTTIELIEYAAPVCQPDPLVGQANRPGIRHLAFAVDDIEKVVEVLKNRGVKFLGPVRSWEKTGKKLVYFYGPDQILLELAQYP